VERAVVLAQGSTVGVTELPPPLQDTEPLLIWSDDSPSLPSTTLAELERLAIVQALQQHHGNRQAAAQALDIGLATLYRKMKTYQLR
jgi:DNA-binding NtrC family response regulator